MHKKGTVREPNYEYLFGLTRISAQSFKSFLANTRRETLDDNLAGDFAEFQAACESQLVWNAPQADNVWAHMAHTLSGHISVYSKAQVVQKRT